MNRTRTWIVAGATVALAGFGTVTAVASDDIQLNDRAAAPAVAMSGQQGGDSEQIRVQAPADASPESADSPAASAFDSPDSPNGTHDPSPESADSPGESPMDSADSPHDSPRDASADTP